MKSQGQNKVLPLDSDSVCRIIDKCKASGVSEITVGDLHLVFQPGQGVSARTPDVEGFSKVKINHERMTKENLEFEEMLVKEDQLAMLLVEDPLEYERQLSNGELLEEDESSDDSSESEPSI